MVYYKQNMAKFLAQRKKGAHVVILHLNLLRRKNESDLSSWYYYNSSLCFLCEIIQLISLKPQKFRQKLHVQFDKRLFQLILGLISLLL